MCCRDTGPAALVCSYIPASISCPLSTDAKGHGRRGCSMLRFLQHQPPRAALSGLRITPCGGRAWGPGCTPASCQPDDCGVERGENEPAFSVKGLLCRGFISAPVGNHMPLTQRAGQPWLPQPLHLCSCCVMSATGVLPLPSHLPLRGTALDF